MPQWIDLFEFIDDNLDEDGCSHKLHYTKKFCKKNNVDFKHVRFHLELFGGICDCIVWQYFDRFKNPYQNIAEKPDLELGVFWTQLFGFLRAKMNVREDPTMPSGYHIECKNSFKFTKDFCAIHGLDENKTLSVLYKTNAISCDCEIITNSRKHFEDDALIGTEPTINLYDMNHPNIILGDLDPDRLNAFRGMK